MAEQPKLAEELKKLNDEPLLPVEKRLVAWSLGLGIALLAIFYWISRAYFPG